MNQKTFYSLIGAAVALTSLIHVFASLPHGEAKKKGSALSLALGIAGLIAGAAIACQPERNARKQLTVGNLLDDEDVERMQAHVAEILGEDHT